MITQALGVSKDESRSASSAERYWPKDWNDMAWACDYSPQLLKLGARHSAYAFRVRDASEGGSLN